MYKAISLKPKAREKKMYTCLNLVKYPMTEFNIDDRDFETLRLMHRIYSENRHSIYLNTSVNPSVCLSVNFLTSSIHVVTGKEQNLTKSLLVKRNFTAEKTEVSVLCEYINYLSLCLCLCLCVFKFPTYSTPK